MSLSREGEGRDGELKKEKERERDLPPATWGPINSDGFSGFSNT